MHRILTIQVSGLWCAMLQKRVPAPLDDFIDNNIKGYTWVNISEVEADNYLQLNVEIGNKKWVELLNKNN